MRTFIHLKQYNMAELKNTIEQEAEEQLKKAHQQAADQQAAAQKMVEQQTKELKKNVLKAAGLGVLMSIGGKIVSAIVGKIKN